VYISGNWYSDDGIEVFDGKKVFSFVKGVSAARSYPYALRISKADAIFFGNTDTENKEYDTIMIDRLWGEPFTVPLFEEWKPEDKEQIQMQRICNLMESEQLYLNTDLKLTDIATSLNTNSRYISDCINSQRGCSFSQFINSYRIEYAKQLLRAKPDEKISNISMKVGFANERSFFRAFKQSFVQVVLIVFCWKLQEVNNSLVLKQVLRIGIIFQQLWRHHLVLVKKCRISLINYAAAQFSRFQPFAVRIKHVKHTLFVRFAPV
jgi:AraC-like DNA-binding protein